MKPGSYILFALLSLLSVFTVSSVYAQHGRGGGGGMHFSGGARISGGAHFSAPAHISGGTRVVTAPARISVGARVIATPAHRVVAPARVYVHGGYIPGHYYYHYPRFWVYGPPIGFRFSVLPFGYLTLGTPFGPYYYYDGTFYQSTQDEQYEVVDPPIGVVIPSLPSGARTVVIDGNTYYEKNGTYYQEVLQDNKTRYVVVGKNGQLENGSSDQNTAPEDNVVAELPEGSRSVEINNQQFYVSPDGMYYQEITNPDNTVSYKIVGKMSADN